MTKHQLFGTLAAMGVARAVVHFSGGNDEGGADGIDFFDAENKPVTVAAAPWIEEVDEYDVKWDRYGVVDGEAPFRLGEKVVSTGEREKYMTPEHTEPAWTSLNGQHSRPEQHFPPQERERQIYRRATAEEIAMRELYRTLEQPVYDRYGSFAGEFSVSGEVEWNVADLTCVMNKSEQVWSDYEEESIEIR